MSSSVATYTQQTAEMQHVIARCLQGDRKAQYEIYQQYHKAMFSICMRITNNYNEAQDVLQEAFVNAFKHLASFKGESTFGAWLKRIVVNAAVQHVKKKKLDLVPLQTKHSRMADEDGHGAVATDDSSYQVEQVRKAIQQLPDGYRVVLSLYLLEGYDHAEIGEILGITESTSKSQFNRAKAKLRTLLSEQVL